MTDQDVIRRASLIVAPVFEAQGWKWAGLVASPRVPTAFDIADKFTDFVERIRSDDEIRGSHSGRLSVYRRIDEDGSSELRLCLDLGYLV